MDKNEAVGGHEDPKERLKREADEAAVDAGLEAIEGFLQASDHEVEATVMYDDTDAALGDLGLFDFDIEMGLKVEVKEDADHGKAAIAMMRLRGALLNATQMMQGGILDLLGGADFTPEMRLAVSSWGTGGRLMLDMTIDSIDEWLASHGFPTVSLYEVSSSNIAAMGWADPTDPQLEAQAVVQFTNGTLYSYEGVPEDVFHDWWNADSHGVYLNTEIKGSYRYKKLVG